MTDPTIGVWISEDGEVGAPDARNLYRFEGNNPENAVDPSGEGAISSVAQMIWDTGTAVITGEEPPPSFRLFMGMVLAPAHPAIPDVTKLYKTPARAFWEWVASDQMEAKGRKFAGLLLRHSLQDNPSKLVLSENHFATIAIRKSKAYKDVIAKIVKDAKAGKCEGTLVVDFSGIPDLDVATGHGSFRYKLNKVDNDNYEIEVQVYDRYNFEVHVEPYYGYGRNTYDSFVKASGNNAAWASQWYMVINGYDWETEWLKEKKGTVK